MNKDMNPRDLALQVLNTLDREPGYPEYHLEKAYRGAAGSSDRDRAFAVHLVQGILRWRLRLDWVIAQVLRFPFRNIQPNVLNVLRLAVYQIFFLDRVPESAAVNEAVKQTKNTAAPHVVRSVNGILREICRRKGRFSFPDKQDDLIHFLSVRYSYPAWLVRKWTGEIGEDGAERLLAAGNKIPCLVVRTNTRRITRAKLIRQFEGTGISALPTHYSPEGLVLEGVKGRLERLPSFRSGLFQVQGEAAQACSHLLSPEPGERVLDVCAGLGGKSTHMAQLMDNRGLIVAVDRSPARLIKLGQTSRRLGIRTIMPVIADAERGICRMFGCHFDRIMIDGPCSALGVISRHPDAKWNRDEQEIIRLSLVQKRIVEEVSPLLRQGGIMLYVTCTLSRAENEGVVEAILEAHQDLKRVHLRQRVPGWAGDLIDEAGFLRLFPHVHGTDGFFAALFEKK